MIGLIYFKYNPGYFMKNLLKGIRTEARGCQSVSHVIEIEVMRNGQIWNIVLMEDPQNLLKMYVQDSGTEDSNDFQSYAMGN